MVPNKHALTFIVELQNFFEKPYNDTQAEVLADMLSKVDPEHLAVVKQNIYTTYKWLPKPSEIMQLVREAQRQDGGNPWVPTEDPRIWIESTFGGILFGTPAELKEEIDKVLRERGFIANEAQTQE